MAYRILRDYQLDNPFAAYPGSESVQHEWSPYVRQDEYYYNPDTSTGYWGPGKLMRQGYDQFGPLQLSNVTVTAPTIENEYVNYLRHLNELPTDNVPTVPSVEPLDLQQYYFMQPQAQLYDDDKLKDANNIAMLRQQLLTGTGSNAATDPNIIKANYIRLLREQGEGAANEYIATISRDPQIAALEVPAAAAATTALAGIGATDGVTSAIKSGLESAGYAGIGSAATNVLSSFGIKLDTKQDWANYYQNNPDLIYTNNQLDIKKANDVLKQLQDEFQTEYNVSINNGKIGNLPSNNNVWEDVFMLVPEGTISVAGYNGVKKILSKIPKIPKINLKSAVPWGIGIGFDTAKYVYYFNKNSQTRKANKLTHINYLRNLLGLQDLQDQDVNYNITSEDSPTYIANPADTIPTNQQQSQEWYPQNTDQSVEGVDM